MLPAWPSSACTGCLFLPSAGHAVCSAAESRVSWRRAAQSACTQVSPRPTTHRPVLLGLGGHMSKSESSQAPSFRIAPIFRNGCQRRQAGDWCAQTQGCIPLASPFMIVRFSAGRPLSIEHPDLVAAARGGGRRTGVPRAGYSGGAAEHECHHPILQSIPHRGARSKPLALTHRRTNFTEPRTAVREYCCMPVSGSFRGYRVKLCSSA